MASKSFAFLLNFYHFSFVLWDLFLPQLNWLTLENKLQISKIERIQNQNESNEAEIRLLSDRYALTQLVVSYNLTKHEKSTHQLFRIESSYLVMQFLQLRYEQLIIKHSYLLSASKTISTNNFSHFFFLCHLRKWFHHVFKGW